MGWINEEPGPLWQWISLLTGLGGTLLTIAAALAAVSAREQAKRAAQAAQRIVRLVEATDLAADLHLLEAAAARVDFDGVASQANRLRGRTARFIQEASGGLSQTEVDSLMSACKLLANITEAAASSRMKADTKLDRVRVTLGELSQVLNVVAGSRQSDLLAKRAGDDK